MTKTTTKTKPAAKQSAPSAPLIVLGYDEHHKPQGARFPAADADLVAKAAQLMGLKVYRAASESWPPLPRSCRSAGCTATAAASCRTSGKACTASSSWRSRSNRRPPSAKTRTSYRSRPACPMYCTSPLAGLWTHQKGGFFHDGRFATLLDVVNRYNSRFNLNLSDANKTDLVEYLKGI